MDVLRRLAASTVVALLLACLALPNAFAITIDWVTVGDPGNAPDTTGYGAVNYEYQIAKYEVTIGQYAAFLNAVAADDIYSLYSQSMGTDLNVAGISRSGSSGSYMYSVIGPSGTTPAGASSPGDRPITYVNWFDSARFANWMSNGQPSGTQGQATTENGAYALNGATSGTAPEVNTTNPNTGLAPLYCIPTEDQWYKAAYYKGGSTTVGYWTYATQADATPGNTIGSGGNEVNYYTGLGYCVTHDLFLSSSQNYLTDVGAFTTSASAYGTFDQSGNVYEWNDLTGAAGSSRGVRGGYWLEPSFFLSSSARDTAAPSGEGNNIGFRLATPVAVPEPSTCIMALAGIACGGFSMWRRRKRA